MAPVSDLRCTVISGNPDVRRLLKQLVQSAQVWSPTSVRSPASRSTAHSDIGRPYLSDRYLPISVRCLRQASITPGHALLPDCIGATPDTFFIVQDPSRYGDICPAHVRAPLLCTSPPHPPASSLIRPPGRHLIAPVDLPLTATSPDDVMMTSPNPGPHGDVMLTSSKKRANKAKKPYLRHFSPFFHIFGKITVKLPACNLRRPRHQSTCSHIQSTLRANPAALFSPDQCLPGISASSSCELVFLELLVKNHHESH